MNIALFIASLATISGLLAAYYWHKSAQIGSDQFDPSKHESILELPVLLLRAYVNTAVLNRKAAFWTAVSVFLSAISAVLSAAHSIPTAW
jgi:hypothetical protein